MGSLKLHDYQIRGVQYWLDNPRAYLAVDMGLGKTAIVLHALTQIKKPALVIAPLRAAYSTWPEEIAKWKLPLSYTILHGKDKGWKFDTHKVDVFITNYESIPFIYDKLYERVKAHKPPPFEVCVIDEGSMLKDPTTKRFKFFDSLRPVFPKYRVILSGTPAPNSLRDLWSQYFFLGDGKILEPRFHKYRSMYFTSHEYNPYEFTLKPGADKTIYKRIAPYTFRLDAKDYLKLPSLTYNNIRLELTPKMRKKYNTYKRDFLVQVGEVELVALNATTLSNKLRQFLSGFNYYNTGETDARGNLKRFTTEIHDLKLKALRHLINEIGQPVLGVIQYKYELEMIKRHYPNAPVIAGGTKNKDAVKFIKQWNAGLLSLLLCHPQSLSHGVNLQTGGCNIVWYSLTWSLEQYQQLNKRLHRQGQKQGVVVNHLVLKDTVDDRVAKVLAMKNTTQQKLLDYLRDESNF